MMMIFLNNILLLTQMYIHKMLRTQVEDIYTYNGNNVNKCLVKIIMSVVPIFI